MYRRIRALIYVVCTICGIIDVGDTLYVAFIHAKNARMTRVYLFSLPFSALWSQPKLIVCRTKTINPWEFGFPYLACASFFLLLLRFLSSNWVKTVARVERFTRQRPQKFRVKRCAFCWWALKFPCARTFTKLTLFGFVTVTHPRVSLLRHLSS